MKYAVLYDGKLYIADDKWVTIRGKNGVGHPVLIKGDGDAGAPIIRTKDPDEIHITGKDGKSIVIKRGKPMTHEQANGGKVNPHYNDGWEYTQNCQSAVVAYELRIRGYDVTVAGFDESKYGFWKLEGEPWEMWKDVKSLHTFIFPTKDEEDKWFTMKGQYDFFRKNVKKGRRYHMTVYWREGGGHVMTVQRIGRNVVVYDPQDGKSYTGTKEIRDGLFKGIDHVKVYRVDNQEMNTVFLNDILVKAGG